jgi:glycosyltransferase involved in cell wall biosynthesis
MNSTPNAPTNEQAVKSSPKISVLIPVYNSERYLAECLDSILTQDFRDFEILIADDGSTDNSLEIIKSYAAKDARIRWWQNPRNLGLSRNHNACLQEARGEFIKFVHQDDKVLHPSAFAKMLEPLERDDSVSLVGAASELINSKSQALALRNYFQKTGTLDGKSVIVKCLEENKNILGEPTLVMFRKSQTARGLDPRYRQIVDMEFWFHLLEQGRFAYIADPLFGYRLHPQQATQSHTQSGVSRDEQMVLFSDYHAKPWLINHATRRMWFKQIYYLRKKYGPRAEQLLSEAKKSISPIAYALCWLEHRMSTPFVRLKEHRLRKRLKL